MWVDALCISWDDTIDRNHQVTLMKNYLMTEMALISVDWVPAEAETGSFNMTDMFDEFREARPSGMISGMKLMKNIHAGDDEAWPRATAAKDHVVEVQISCPSGRPWG
jgi:hypothetical protein